MWKLIDGYKYVYRIDENAVVQKKKSDGTWFTLKPRNHRYAVVRLIRTDGKQREVSLSSLMDLCFFNGYAKKHGLAMYHKNGVIMDCSKENLEPRPRKEIGHMVGHKRPGKPVVRIGKSEPEFYRSIADAAKKNGLTRTALEYRIKNRIYDPRGYLFDLEGNVV